MNNHDLDILENYTPSSLKYLVIDGNGLDIEAFVEIVIQSQYDLQSLISISYDFFFFYHRPCVKCIMINKKITSIIYSPNPTCTF